MCTVTFIARPRGCCLGMNRDEKLTGPLGLPPKQKMVNGRGVVCPSELGAGTWIAVNDHGVTFALINWSAIKTRVGDEVVSRGQVVDSVITAISSISADAFLSRLPLKRINPFRLIGIFPAASRIVEW